MMPPLLATVHILPGAARRGVRLWVPLFLIWLLLVPFALVLLPVYFVVCAVVDIHPLRTLGAALAVLASLHGTLVEVDSPSASIFIEVF